MDSRLIEIFARAEACERICRNGFEKAEAACIGLTLEEALKLPEAPVWAYYYAHYVLKGRWPEAEEAIATDPQMAYRYAFDVIKGRWPEAESTIATHPLWSFYYFGVPVIVLTSSPTTV